MPLLSYDREVTGRETILDSHQSRQPTQYTPYTAFWNVGNVSRPWQHWGCSGQSPHGYCGAPFPCHKPAGLRFVRQHHPREEPILLPGARKTVTTHRRGIVVEAGSRVGGFHRGSPGRFADGNAGSRQNGPVAVSWPATTCVPADGRG